MLFVPALEPCAAGTLPDDVLRINGSTGGFGYSVDIKAGAPLTIEMLQPAAWPGSSDFVLFGVLGTPVPADKFPFSPSIGSLCFMPGVLAPQNPLLFTLVSSIPSVPGALPLAPPPSRQPQRQPTPPCAPTRTSEHFANLYHGTLARYGN